MGLSLPHFASLRGTKQSRNDIFYSRKQDIFNFLCFRKQKNSDFYTLESRKSPFFMLWKAENAYFCSIKNYDYGLSRHFTSCESV